MIKLILRSCQALAFTLSPVIVWHEKTKMIGKSPFSNELHDHMV